MNITLDENHIYRVDGVIKPGVSEILQYNGLISYWCKDPFAAEKGTAIHAAGALLFQQLLDWDSLDSRILPYVQSLDAFIKQTGFEAMTVEYMGYNEKVGYCGTLDIWGKFPFDVWGRFSLPEQDQNCYVRTVYGPDWVLDLKSGAAARWHCLQTAAYQAMIGSTRRGCLYLQPDGSLAKLVEHTDKNDWICFLSCARIYKKETQMEKELEQDRKNLEEWRR